MKHFLFIIMMMLVVPSAYAADVGVSSVSASPDSMAALTSEIILNRK